MASSTAMETIAAIATPPGRGGVGIVRVSGPSVPKIAEAMLGKLPVPRYANYTIFKDENDNAIDIGIALYFKSPNSFTGEDVLELQGHGGQVILDMLLQSVVKLGARVARPGEFSERAFLNDKLDLAQAEAIADLIDSESEQAARFAIRSLQGEFSRQIHILVEQLIQLRVFVESAIDFPEEEIDFLQDKELQQRLDTVTQLLSKVLESAKQGSLLREGMSLVIAGQPNAGKSTLLNVLSGKDVAIVTDVPGTTRDVLREHIQIDGLPLHIIDTAGLRDVADVVEQEGIRRAQDEIEKADRILYVVDVTQDDFANDKKLLNSLNVSKTGVTIVFNKIDLQPDLPEDIASGNDYIAISAKSGEGVTDLRTHLKKCVGYQLQTEGGFIARRRHISALQQAWIHINTGTEQLVNNAAGELMAEELRQAQHCLSTITGEFSADDLLGEIFSSFCIGK